MKPKQRHMKDTTPWPTTESNSLKSSQRRTSKQRGETGRQQVRGEQGEHTPGGIREELKQKCLSSFKSTPTGNLPETQVPLRVTQVCEDAHRHHGALQMGGLQVWELSGKDGDGGPSTGGRGRGIQTGIFTRSEEHQKWQGHSKYFRLFF